MKEMMEKPGADSLAETPEECAEAFTSVLKKHGIHKHTFLRNVGLAAGSSKSKHELLPLPDQLIAERETTSRLRADIDRLVVAQQSLEIKIQVSSEERDAVLNEKAKLDEMPPVSDR